MSKEKEEYRISEIAEMMGVSVDTIRYYDREGLLPKVKRVGGQRVFTIADFGHLRTLNCMKKTGMSIRDIRRYFELCEKGDESLNERLELLRSQKKNVQDQMDSLQKNMKQLDYKIWYYETAIAAGSESIHQKVSRSASMEPDEIPSKWPSGMRKGE